MAPARGGGAPGDALALALAALDFAGRTVEVPASPNATAEELVALALRKRRDDAHAALAALEAREAEELQGRGEGRMPRDWATALDLLAPVRDDDPERPRWRALCSWCA